ncbi:MAG: hypothetical protein IJ660_06270 [Alphaproteobacteria bacterium]|nr:hypothetical protein [Alphaproteobacteria bacterium]
MKKIIIYLLAAVFILLLTGCKSDPIKPQIIGTAYLQEEKGIIFAEFDSVRYVPQIVYTGEKPEYEGIERSVLPIVGLQVTCFTCRRHSEPVFFSGKVTTEQLEKYYRPNYTNIFIKVFVTIMLLFIMLFIIIVGVIIVHATA